MLAQKRDKIMYKNTFSNFYYYFQLDTWPTHPLPVFLDFWNFFFYMAPKPTHRWEGEALSAPERATTDGAPAYERHSGPREGRQAPRRWSVEVSGPDWQSEAAGSTKTQHTQVGWLGSKSHTPGLVIDTNTQS